MSKKKHTWWQRDRRAATISGIIVMIMILGVFWYIDSTEWEFPKEWLDWYEERFFLIRLGIIMVFYAVIIQLWNLIFIGTKYVVRRIMGL